MGFCLRILLLLGLSLYSYGQQSARYGGAGFFRAGYAQFHQVSRALESFTPTTMTPLGNDFLCIGGEGYGRLNKYIIGGTGYGMVRRSVVRNSIHARPFSGGGFLHVGRIVVDQPRFWLYPSVGLGFSMIGLTQYEQDPSGQRLHESSVFLPNVNVHVGIGADWLAVPIGGDYGKQSGGILLGVRVGYQLSPLTANWRGDEPAQGREEPRYATNGYYVTLTLGAGGFIRR